MHHNIMVSLLKQEVKPAYGCTEPAAVALAAARAAGMLGGRIERISVRVSPNILKNALAVTIPNTGEAGLNLAAALGLLIGKPEKELELLQSVTPEDVEKAHRFMDLGRVQIGLAKAGGVYILARVEGERGWAEVSVAGSHADMHKAVVNGSTVFVRNERDGRPDPDFAVDLSPYTIGDLLEVIETVPLEDICFLEDGIDMNLLASAKGLESRPGLGVGAGLKALLEKGILRDDIVGRVRIAVAAACDARMAGLGLPVMSTMGSGNHGIGAIVPPAVVARELGSPQEKIIRALALSHLVTAYVKQYTGKLSSICGCSVASSAGSAAAVTWLMGGRLKQIEGAVKNIIGNLAGMICDGAKGGCSLKLSTSAGEAVISSYLALNDIVISSRDGIIADTIEETIRNLGMVSSQGMSGADRVILEILLGKQNACRRQGRAGRA